MAIYKRSRGVEPRTTWNKSSYWSERDLNSGSQISSPKSLSEVEDPTTSFLGNISQAEEKTSEAVTVKLAEFVNKRFSAKLGDGKYKEKFDKYGRPSNCDKGKPQ